MNKKVVINKLKVEILKDRKISFEVLNYVKENLKNNNIIDILEIILQNIDNVIIEDYDLLRYILLSFFKIYDYCFELDEMRSIVSSILNKNVSKKIIAKYIQIKKDCIKHSFKRNQTKDHFDIINQELINLSERIDREFN